MARKASGYKRHMLHFTLREEIPAEAAVWAKLEPLINSKELSDILRRAVFASDEIKTLVLADKAREWSASLPKSDGVFGPGSAAVASATADYIDNLIMSDLPEPHYEDIVE